MRVISFIESRGNTESVVALAVSIVTSSENNKYSLPPTTEPVPQIVVSTISDQPGSVFVTDTTGGDVLVSTLEGVASDLEVFKDELSVVEPSSSFFPAPLLLSAHLSLPPSELGVAADDFSSPPSSPSILPAFSSSCLSSYLSESGLDADVSSYSIVTSID